MGQYRLTKKADGSTAVQHAKGEKAGEFAGTLPAPVKPKAQAEGDVRDIAVKLVQAKLAREAMSGSSSLPGVQEAYEKILEEEQRLLSEFPGAIKEAETAGVNIEDVLRKVENFTSEGAPPVAVSFGVFEGEDPNKMSFAELSNMGIVTKTRDFDVADAGNYTKSFLATLTIAIHGGQPVMIEGPPGEGKTQSVIAVARQLGAEVISLNAAGEDPADLLGVRAIHMEEGMGPAGAYAPKIPSEWIRRVQNNPHKRFVVFLDELTNAPSDVRAALLTVILDRKAGNNYMGKNVTFVAAGNPAETATNGYEFDTATSNRFTHLEYKRPSQEVIDDFKKGYYTAPNIRPDRARWEEENEMVKSTLIAYLESTGGSVNNEPSEGDPEYGKGWASSRSWSNLVPLIATARASGAHDQVLRNLAIGTVGKKQGIAFVEYLKKNDLPPVKTVLDHPDRWNPPNTDRAYATIEAILTDARKKTEPVLDDDGTTKERLTDLVYARKMGQVIKRASELGHSDLAAKMTQEWIGMYPKNKVPDTDVLMSMHNVVYAAEKGEGQ